ncbi:uncharacterized protein LOC142814448 [Rhipicephalus microplus]|uniref:uncharacterized protein LOC142814448 n=1 Tax=Rhipicephalus microplus TaxID=6941 RepID=UPI003F6D83E8
MAQFRFVRLFYFVQALVRFATYPSCHVSRTVYLMPTDQQSNQPVHSDSGETPYHLMTFNDYPQDASLHLTRTAASTKQPVSAQAITRLGASHRFSGHGKVTCDTMAQFRFVRLFYFVQALVRFATYPSCHVSRTVYLMPTDQQSNQPVHSDSGETPYHLMTFNDYPQDASLHLTRTAASTKQPVSAQAITRLGASHRFSGHGKVTCDTMAQFRFVRLFYFVQGILGLAILPTAGRLRISKLCISDADQRMPMRHRMEPLSLNDTASTTAQFTAHSTGDRLWVATSAQRRATSSLDIAMKGSPQAFDPRGHCGPGATMALTSMFCLMQVVQVPTRVQRDSPSILDLVFLNRKFSEYTVEG